MSGGLSIASGIIWEDERANCRMLGQNIFDSHNMTKYMDKHGSLSIKTTKYKIVDIDEPEH